MHSTYVTAAMSRMIATFPVLARLLLDLRYKLVSKVERLDEA